MDPMTLSMMFNVGSSIFGSLFGGDEEEQQRRNQLTAEVERAGGQIRGADLAARAADSDARIGEIGLDEIRTSAAVAESERRRQFTTLSKANQARGDASSASFRAIQRQAERDADADIKTIRYQRDMGLSAQRIRIAGARIEGATHREHALELAMKKARAEEALDHHESDSALSTLFDVGSTLFQGYQNGVFDGVNFGSWFGSSSTADALSKSAIWT